MSGTKYETSIPPTEQESLVDLLIPHPLLAQALLERDTQAGWRLPRMRGGPPWVGRMPELLSEVRKRFGLEVILLRSAAPGADQPGRASYTYELDALSGGAPLPPDTCWVDLTELGRLWLVDPNQRTLLERFLGTLTSGGRARRSPPWARPGWLAEARTWMGELLVGLGQPLVGPVEQVKCWSISTVLRGRTATGDVYLKASAPLPLFVNEPVVMATLTRLFPGQIARPLFIDPTRQWMLLAAFDHVIGHCGSVDERAGMLRAFGQIQRASAERVGELLKAGCLDRRLEVLAGQIAALAADEAALAALTEDERARFRALVPELQQRCADLAACGLPETLVHGDLHIGNVALHEGRYHFFDWTHACVAHPFFDLNAIFHERNTALQELLRDEYLKVWACDAPAERLRQGVELARPLCFLHHAISYLHINAGLEDAAQIDFAGEAERQVRLALDHL